MRDIVDWIAGGIDKAFLFVCEAAWQLVKLTIVLLFVSAIGFGLFVALQFLTGN